MKNSTFKVQTFLIFFAVLYFAVGVCTAVAQSTNQSFPTAVTANEISGEIRARDIGDARLTSYFYIFNGNQGDVFINVVTTNFNGDIDIFTADNLRPLTKITIYADTSDNETGRIVYLRQPAKLILRIEGRPLNDNAATFRIKFAGTFVAALPTAENPASETPTVKSDNQSDVRVNSVGTIIEVQPKPIAPKEIVAENPVAKPSPATKPTKRTKEKIETNQKSEIAPEEKKVETRTTVTIEKPVEIAENKNQSDEKTENREETKPTILTIERPAETIEQPSEKETPKVENVEKTSTEKTDEKTTLTTEKEIAPKENETIKEKKEKTSPKVIKPLPSSALENIRLVIQFKDGTKIERPMSEVVKFGIDKGVLTIITKDGVISRISILDVEKTTIE